MERLIHDLLKELGEDPEREVDPKYPCPRKAVDDDATRQRPDYG